MFNEQQQEAINSKKGRIRVIAGAGSGKTSTLVERYAQLIKDGVKPSNILCITFTNKAAQEMSDRIKRKVGDIKISQICTFHAFCLRILKENIHKIGYPNTFVVLDTDDQNKIIRGIYKENKIDYKEVSYSTSLDLVGCRKILNEDSMEFITKNDDTLKNLYNESKSNYAKAKHDPFMNVETYLQDTIYYGYLYNQQKAKGLDFNDLIIFAVSLFKQDNKLLKRWQDKLEYIMVDEFQDVSDRQNELVEMLSKKHGNLFVVGDPDQTIYSWRGAKPEILVDFDKIGKTKTIIMNQNYRSTPEILKIANDIIAENKLRVEKDLFTKNKSGEKVFYNHYEWQGIEGQGVVRIIKNLLKKYKPCDIAVLYRMHFLSRFVEEELIKAQIPYTIYSGVNFYERQEIKDILAYLRLILNSDDDIAFERIINVPSRKIGDKKVAELKESAEKNGTSMFSALSNAAYSYKGKAQENAEDFMFLITEMHAKALNGKMSLSDFVHDVIVKSGYIKLLQLDIEKERKENVEELLNSIRELDDKTSLADYLQKIALMTSEDKKEKRDTVKLMTIHSAKGLEFPVVFVVGMSEGNMPSGKADSEYELEEERRLAYVAYTRAKERLYLSDSGGTDFRGNEKVTSRFIAEIKDDVHAEKHETITYSPFKLWKFKS